MRTFAKAFLIVMAAAVLISWSARAADECAAPVTTASGQVSGSRDPELAVCVWKGIPFAAPPVGELRFRAPQPVAAWSGVRPALAYGHECMQVPKRDNMDEDCLYLNVWRPQQAGTFPVMVWIHGGGYVMGSGGSGLAGRASYDGANLASFGDVIVVTINYRLSVFGFLADAALRREDANQSAGNYGSLDQVAAIKWVHDNIAGFGGDPQNVTIFGESAGGWSVCAMLATPLLRGQFQRAILESGGCTKSEDLETGYAKSAPVEKKVGCAPGDLNCLRRVPAKKLLASIGLVHHGMMWGPHHDGYLLTATPLSMIRAGDYNQVPFMAGFNRNEVDAVLFLLPYFWYGLPSQYDETLERYLGLTDAEAQTVAALYPLSRYDRPRYAYGAMFTDMSLACPTYLGIQAAAAHQSAVYLYRFDYTGIKYGEHVGAFHSLEVGFVFGSIKPGGLFDETNIGPARELSRVIQGYWTNFAKTGDPNGPNLPAWPRFTSDQQNLQVLDNRTEGAPSQVRTEPAGMSDRCAFWDNYLERHRPEETLGRKPQP